MAYLVFAAIIWGSSFPIIRHTLPHVSPILLLILRFSLAFIILLPRFSSFRKMRMLFHRDVILISIPNALAFILQFKAQELTTASKTALFVNTSPLFVVILAAVLLKERATSRQLIALVIALAGVFVTSTSLDFSELSFINIGDVLCVVVGLSWAVFIVYSKNVVKTYHPLDLALALYFWSAIFALPMLAFEEARFAWAGIPAILYLASITTVLAYFFFLKGVRRISALATSLIILIEVIVAFLISHHLLGESYSPVEAVGVGMVLVGILMVLRK
jgi:drug/metabolite transporter (DMT)-like permease